jgi:hypothetical protein
MAIIPDRAAALRAANEIVNARARRAAALDDA